MPDNPKRKRCSSTDRRWRSSIVRDVTGNIVSNCFGFAITWTWFTLFVTSFALDLFVRHLHFCLPETLLPCRWATKASYQCKRAATMLFSCNQDAKTPSCAKWEAETLLRCKRDAKTLSCKPDVNGGSKRHYQNRRPKVNQIFAFDHQKVALWKQKPWYIPAPTLMVVLNNWN